MKKNLMSQFNQRPPNPTSLADALTLLDSFWAIILDQRETIEQLQVNSKNSSKPPSTDRLANQTSGEARKRKPSGLKRGAQPGHKRNMREMVPTSQVDHIERHFPDAQCICGSEIIMDAEPRDRHQIFDLPKITYSVTEHQRFGGTCPCCQRSVVAKLPQEIPSGQMGPGLIAWIALLNGHLRMSTRSIQTFLEMQWGLKFSTGAISESQAPVAEWLGPLCQQIAETIRRAPVAHADETTHFREHKRLWLWVLCTTQLAYFIVNPSRAMKATRELLGSFTGILISDRHGGYNTFPSCQRQLCWAHVIRNLERISGRKGDPGVLGLWMVRFARIIIQLEHRWRKSGYQSEHYRRRLQEARANFRTSLEQGLAQHQGQRTGNACKRLLEDEPMLWRFLESPGIDLTNNTAERALRPYVIWRKTSFFSQSERGDSFRARVLTVTESCKRLDLCAYALLREVCEQGMTQQKVTVRLPIDHLYRTPESHQLENKKAA